MSNFTITIQAPELVNAILALAQALEQKQIQPSAPAATPVAQPTGTLTASPTQAPAATPTQPPAPAVPTTTQTYTMEQLAVAATQLVDAGRREELVQLLRQFGVEALTQLPKEQYGAFATALRQMGAKV